MKYRAEDNTLLHLDHIPVIDEDGKPAEYMDIMRRAVALGFQSVMLDGSRLSLADNIRCTAEVAEFVHAFDIPCEAELGAVMGQESVMPPYEEIFQKKMGFTKVDEAVRFVKESGCDWLSVAAGSVHGRIAEAVRNQKKPAARLDVSHIREIYEQVQIPLVLHGGSGIRYEYIMDAIASGIAKINVGTELRQTYEFALEEKPGDIPFAQDKVYQKVREYLHDYLDISGLRKQIKA